MTMMFSQLHHFKPETQKPINMETNQKTAKVAVYETHEDALNAVKKLKEHGISLKHVSLVGKAEVDDDHLHIKNMDKRTSAPAVVGAGAGLLVGILTGLGVFAIPGFGFLYGAGAVIGAIGGFDIGLAGGGVISLLAKLGIKEDEVVEYEEHLHGGKFIVVVNGSDREVEVARDVLHTEGSHISLK